MVILRSLMENEMKIMDWRICKENHVKEVERDTEKIESIKEAVKRRILYLDSVEVDKNNVSFIVEGFYEAIKELLVALLLSNGLSSGNHQCLISYFYNNYDYEDKAFLIARMSYLRNRLDYYGELIDFEFYEKHKEDFKEVIKTLNGLIKDE